MARKTLTPEEISRRMNAWLRGGRQQGQAPVAQTQPDEDVRSVPPGNAGAGCGTPVPSAPARSMDTWLRTVWLRGDKRTFRTGD